MFSQLNPPADNGVEAVAIPPPRNTNLLANVGRFLPIAILSAFTVGMFIQLQALQLQVVSEQNQIDQLKQ